MNANDQAAFIASFVEFCDTAEIIGNKGPLAAMLSINRQARNMDWPLDPDLMVTGKGGQVKGLGEAATQRVLKDHGVTRVLAREGGRTSRGIMDVMRAYLAFLSAQRTKYGEVDFDAVEAVLVGMVKAYFASQPFVLKLDPSWGVRTAVRHLTEQAIARQKAATGSMFLGTMMQHLVGAKLQVILPAGSVTHHSANQSDQKPDRHGDFDISDVAIHVSTAPSEALIRKCGENLGKGKRPVIVTTRKGMLTAEGLLENAGISDRVDLIEFEQFLATNVFEIGKFSSEGQRATFEKIVETYNAVISAHETDPGLRIEMAAGK